MKSSLILFVLVISLSIFNSEQASARKKILVTSFDAFGGREKNNSALVSEELKRLFSDHPELSSHYSLEFIVLPVQARVAAQKARDYIDRMQEKPDLVLSLGESSRLAKSGKSIEINFQAYNRQSKQIYADDRKTVSWDTSRDGKIYPYWDDTIKFNLPFMQMYCSLHEDEKKWVSLEDNIGSYVCNDTAFDLALYLRDQNEKNTRAQSLSWTHESSKKSELASLSEEEKRVLKNLEDIVKTAELAENKILIEIQQNPNLKNQLPRLYELIDSEKQGHKRYKLDNRSYDTNDDWNSRSQSQRENLSMEGYWDTKTGTWGYRNRNTTTPSDRTRNQRDNDFSRPYYNPQTSNPRYQENRAEERVEYLLPQKLLDYKNAMEDSSRKRRDLDWRRQDFNNREQNIINKYDRIINSIQNVANDSYLESRKPIFGFIHIPILTQGKKTSPLELAQVMAIMIKGSLDNKFPYAKFDEKSRKVNCGLSRDFLNTESYQIAASSYNSIKNQLASAYSNFRSSLPKEEAVWNEEDLDKLSRKGKYKDNPYAQNILKLKRELEIKKIELDKVTASAPQAHSQKLDYFRGYEKYMAQGDFDKNKASEHLLRMSFNKTNKDVNTPLEFDFKIQTDSNNNIVFLIRDELGREQTVNLSSFETQPITLVNISSRSAMTAKLDNTRSYSKYDLRSLRGKSGTYTELNSKLEYWMNIQYSYPILKQRTEYYEVDRYNNEGNKYKAREPRTVHYWETSSSSFSINFKFESSTGWNFYYQDKPFNAIQLTLDKNSENYDFIKSINVFNIDIKEPEPPLPIGAFFLLIFLNKTYSL